MREEAARRAITAALRRVESILASAINAVIYIAKGIGNAHRGHSAETSTP